MDEMSEGFSSAATLKLLFKEAWRIHEAGDNDAANAIAFELLFEPLLGSYYWDRIHIILTTSPDNSFDYSIKALRRYKDALERYVLTKVEENSTTAEFRDGMKRLGKAVQDQARIIQQIQEQEKQRLDAEAAGTSGDVPDSQSVRMMTGESQLSSQRTVSLRTKVNQTDNSRDTIGMKLDDDNKVGSGLKNDEDQV